MMLARLLGLMPVKVTISGVARKAVLAVGDMLYPRLRAGIRMTLAVPPTTLEVDTSHANERLLCYAYSNILRAYGRSPLFLAMRKYLSPGVTFLDVGANLGVYGVLAKTRLGARVVSFEPEYRHFEFLRRNPHVFDETYPFALGDTDGESTLYVAGDANPGASSLVQSGAAGGKSAYVSRANVTVRRFDSVVSPALNVGLVKIDVEGAEAAVVRGMSRFLEAGPRPAIWCEVRGPSSDRNPNSFRDVCDFLNGFGYTPCIGAKGRAFDIAGAHAPRVFDLLFVAPQG